MTPPDRIRFHAVRALATALLVVMSVRAAHAQPVAPRFLTERLAPGVWAVRPVDSVGFGMDANSLVVEGRTGALVVDAQMSATSTRAVIAAVRAVTRRPVRYLVHTHWHDDHVAGAAEWQRAVPDIVIVGGTRMAADMATQGAKNRAGFLGQIPGTVAYLRDLAAKRRGLDGAATDSTETAAYVRYAKLIERFAAESALVPHVAPTRTVDDSLVLELGARRVVARVIGAGHTAADVVVDVPDAGVIATGDLVITPVPFVGSTSFPRSYAATLGRLLLRPHRVLLPGHGGPLRDDAFVRRMRTMLVALAADVDARRTAGEPLDSVRTHVTLADARAAFAGADRLRNALFSTYVVSSAIPKAFADGVEAASAAAPGTFVDSAQAARLAFRRASAARRAGLADSAWHDVSRGAAWFPGQAAYPEAAARMAARRGDLAALLPLLDGLARAGTGEALLNDSTIGRIAASDARVEAARARLASALAPVSRSVVHATIADTAFFPEGIASDARTGAVYVSGIRAKGVARVDGARLVPVFTGGPRDGAAVGVAVDGARGVLWVATASLPFVQAPAGDTLRAELLRVRLTDGVVERRWRLGEGTGVPGEMTLAANGDVIVSDGVKARLYRLRAGADSLETLRDPLLNSPQGIAVRDDGRVAFVADWSHGILRWDLATDVIERVVPPAGQSLVGIDGLRLHRGRLVGIQNGLAPARVLAITLGDDGRRAEAVRVLDRQRAYDGDITVGTTVGDRYLFVASSQWPWFDDDGKRTDARALPPVVIRALPLDW